MSSRTRPLRRDAQRNRDLLVAAARRLFAEQGLGVAVRDVADAAGVAIGTLYNNFPTREELISAVFADRSQTVVEIAGHALSMPDAWDGLVHFLERLCELQAADRGYNEMVSRRRAPAEPTEDQQRGYQLMSRIIERAQESGQLRPDFTLADVSFLTWGAGRTMEMTGGVRPQAWRRHLAFMLDGLRASAAHPVPEPPLRPDELANVLGAC
jgi:AcrR family transcriptional regulator